MQSTSKEVSKFFLILAAVFGLVVRLYPVIKVDFPLVDGGMFYTMIYDLQAAKFSLPAFTTYNNAGIAYAYPPLGFYLAGFINNTSGLSTLFILQWMPVIVNILCIPFFYLFMREITDSESKAALATLLFVFIPNSYWWSIVGGGLTRSLGTFFFIATLWSAMKMIRCGTLTWVVLTSLMGAGVVLSHLSWVLQTVIALLLLWIFFGRDKKHSLHFILVAICVFVLTSPWWVTVLSQHGINVFIQAFQVNHSRWLAWTILFALSFTGEMAPVLAVFAMIGLFIHLSKRDTFPIVWALLCLLSDPRGGTFASVFPFALLAAGAITNGIAPQFTQPAESWESSLNSKAGKIFFGFFVILFLYNAYLISDNLSREVLSTEQREALQWVHENTKENSVFLVFDDQSNPLLTPLVEWFPALSARRNLTTIQGTEWLIGREHYNKQLPVIMNIRQCLFQDAVCIFTATGEMSFDHILIASHGHTPLVDSLNSRSDFTLVYETSTVRIYRHTEK